MSPTLYLSDGTTLADALSAAHIVLYRPRTSGCQVWGAAGVFLAGELEQLLRDTFRAYNLSLNSLACVASATLKQEEPGLLALSEKYGVPFLCYESEELNALFKDVVNGDAGCRASEPVSQRQAPGGRMGGGGTGGIAGVRRIATPDHQADCPARHGSRCQERNPTARRGPDDAK